MPLTTFSDGAVIEASEHNANFALCVLTDTARTISVTHTWTAAQTFTGGFTAAAASSMTARLTLTDLTVTTQQLITPSGGASATPMQQMGYTATVPAAAITAMGVGANTLLYNNGAEPVRFFGLTGASAGQVKWRGIVCGGTVNSPTATPSGAQLANFEGSGYDGANWESGAYVGLRMIAAEDWSGSANGTQMDFYVTINGTTTSVLGMRLRNDRILEMQNGITSLGGMIVSTADTAGAIGSRPTTATKHCFEAWNKDTSGNNLFHVFYTEAGGTERGSIDFNRGGTLTRYNTTSDGTLKTILRDAPRETSTALLSAIRLREYYWNEDATQKKQIGPIAQELYDSGFRGAVKVGGMVNDKYVPWAVDKTAPVWHLVAGWQDHEARLAALEAHLRGN